PRLTGQRRVRRGGSVWAAAGAGMRPSAPSVVWRGSAGLVVVPRYSCSGSGQPCCCAVAVGPVAARVPPRSVADREGSRAVRKCLFGDGNLAAVADLDGVRPLARGHVVHGEGEHAHGLDILRIGDLADSDDGAVGITDGDSATDPEIGVAAD